MLRKYSNSRSLKDNIQLGVLTAFAAGMVNVASVAIFFSFTSNVTGHFAILAEEIAKQNWYQAAAVLAWIAAFFIGNFITNLIVIHAKEKSRQLSHVIPLVLEIACLLSVGFYGQYFYQETLMETEWLVGILLFAMGIQNGLTASISNFAVKTTHLTGLTTDLAILLSMFTKKSYRENEELKGKAQLLLSVVTSYMIGGIIAGVIILVAQFKVFWFASFVIVLVVLYDYSKVKVTRYIRTKRALGYMNE